MIRSVQQGPGGWLRAGVAAMLFLTAAALFALPASKAKAGDMTVCNRSNERMEYALIWNDGVLIFNPTWRAAGWRRLEAGSCVTEIRGDIAQHVYLSIHYVDSSGRRRIADYGFDNREPCYYCDTEMMAISDEYCVRDEPFSRQESSLAAMAVCPEGYQLEIFNIWAYSIAPASLDMDFR